MTRLYDLERDQDIKIFCEVSDGSKYVVFGHIDGMYSYCTTEKGGVVHLSASTPLKEVDGGYAIDSDADKVDDLIAEETVSPESDDDDEVKEKDDDDDDSLLGDIVGASFGGGSSGGGGSNGSW